MKQGYTPCYAQLGDLNQYNNKNIFGQKTQMTQQSIKVSLNKTQVSCEGSGGSALMTVACKDSGGSVFKH